MPKLRVTPRDPSLQKAIREAFSGYQRRHDITNAELASRLGVDESTVSKFMNDKQGISVDTLVRAIVDLEIEIVYNGRVVKVSDFRPGTSPDQLHLFTQNP